MQTILGSGGAIGIPLALELRKYTDQVRLVARNPKMVNDNDELFPADLTNKQEVDEAVKGSEIAYLTVGLTYNIKIWERDWPLIMDNVIDACVRHNANLVFFDNVYMYSPQAIPHMTEESETLPETKKGKLRLKLINMIFEAIKGRQLTALVARSADFYGPNCKTGILNLLVIDNLKKNKRAMWQADVHKIHSFTYTPDAARAVAQLGNTPDVYNQVWHLPTSHEKLTGAQYIERVSAMMNRPPKYFILSKMLISMMAIFMPLMRELKEMIYQYDRDYFFDSTKFVKRFGWGARDYDAGLRETIRTTD
jgi:nucleoside-diphosphate-sugar epimerase